LQEEEQGPRRIRPVSSMLLLGGACDALDADLLLHFRLKTIQHRTVASSLMCLTKNIGASFSYA
jgi:hypothetical protein